MAETTTCSPIDRLMQTLKVHVPGVTDPLLQLEIFNVIDEFLRRTSAWRYRTDITLEVNVAEYFLATPADAEVVRAMGVVHNGLPLTGRAVGGTGSAYIQSSLGELLPEQTFPDGDASYLPAISDIQPTGMFTYAIYRPNYISVAGLPDVEAVKYPLQVDLALTIAAGCVECDCGDWMLPDWMYPMFFQDWLDGTLGRLYGMPAKPWASPTIAAYHAKRFRNRMAFRKQEAIRGYAYGVPGWRFPRSW
jgi:hypothetical protein